MIRGVWDRQTDQPRRVGLLAGWGRFPLLVAAALRRQGFEVVGLGVKDHADPALESLCVAYRTVGLARLGAAIRFLKRHGAERATMAGKIHKVLMFQPFSWIRHCPDWRFLRTFYPHWITRTKDRKDDTLLGALVGAYAEEGIEIAPPTDFAPELLVRYGQLTRRGPTASQRQDIAFGWNLAREMGRLDVGQSVLVKSRAVIAVEAVEGTDLCIRRAGELCPSGGFTLVKVAKPQQDMRFDVPTIGKQTLETLIAAGGATLAIEAGKTIILDEPEVISLANRHGVSIVAWSEEQALAAA